VNRAIIMLAVLAVSCTDDVDPAWQLDHDRVIAIRATPSRIASGEVALIDALLGRAGEPPFETDPETVMVLTPTVLANTLTQQGTQWRVTAPGPMELAAARSELGLEAGAPVPLRVRMTFPYPNNVTKSALKIIWLGEHAENPVLGPVFVEGVDQSAATMLTVAPLTNIPLEVDFDETYVVNWLTSCGTMHDFDLARSYLRVETEDDQSGTLGVVVRDELGGVTWKTWPITAE